MAQKLKSASGKTKKDKGWLETYWYNTPAHSPVITALQDFLDGLKGSENRELTFEEEFKLGAVYYNRTKENEVKEDSEFVGNLIEQMWGNGAWYVYYNLQRLQEEGLFNQSCYNVIVGHKAVYERTNFLIELKARNLLTNETIDFVRSSELWHSSHSVMRYFEQLRKAKCFNTNMISIANVIIEPDAAYSRGYISDEMISVLECLDRSKALTPRTAQIVCGMSFSRIDNLLAALRLLQSEELLAEDIVLPLAGKSECDFAEYAQALILLKQAGIYSQDTIQIVKNEINHIHDLLLAFNLLYADGLLTEQMVSRFANYKIHLHETFVKAVILLEDADLAAENCISLLEQCDDAIERARLMVFLKQAGVVSREQTSYFNKFSFAEPARQLEIYQLLHREGTGLLNRENIKAVQSAPDLQSLQRWLEKLQHADLLTQHKIEMALSRPDAGFVIQRMIEKKRRPQAEDVASPAAALATHGLLAAPAKRKKGTQVNNKSNRPAL